MTSVGDFAWEFDTFGARIIFGPYSVPIEFETLARLRGRLGDRSRSRIRSLTPRIRSLTPPDSVPRVQHMWATTPALWDPSPLVQANRLGWKGGPVRPCGFGCPHSAHPLPILAPFPLVLHHTITMHINNTYCWRMCVHTFLSSFFLLFGQTIFRSQGVGCCEMGGP